MYTYSIFLYSKWINKTLVKTGNTIQAKFMLIWGLIAAPRVGANYLPLTRTLHHYD